MNILVSALGAVPAIIEEAIGFFNFSEAYDFYAESPSLSQIHEARAQVERAGELWLVSTDQPHQETRAADGRIRIINSTEENFSLIKNDCARYGVKIRLFVLQGVPDIKTSADAEAFHDLTLRVVRYAKSQACGGKLYLSLACGRKTMSADMQDAAWCFGCDMLLHILGDNPQNAQPVLLGRVTANPALREMREKAPSFVFDGGTALCPPQTGFLERIQAQKARAQHFFTTYYLGEEKSRANFHILYTLPPDRIQALQRERIGLDPKRREEELAWLAALPKTDLHCHLGGVLAPKDMLAVASCYAEEITAAAQESPDFAAWLRDPAKDAPEADGWKIWLGNLAQRLGVHRSLIAASFLLYFQDCPNELEGRIFGAYLNEHAFRAIGLAAYEGLGDLQGSALLCQEAALRRTLRILLQKCRKENVLYLELRCSPLNYATEKFPVEAVLRAICEELETAKAAVESSVLLIATRHGDAARVRDNIKKSIALVENCQHNAWFDSSFRGFDLAGNENAMPPEELRGEFLDIMQNCYNITIHAGETAPAENIWQAVYHLNAERVGHGLTLCEHPDLMTKFLERGIGIEMCPSSNFQIRGFRDNYFPEESSALPEYPLKNYLDKELEVSVNTDDPGISRTSPANELLRAARLTKGGLSKWEILQLVCNGFRTAFYPYEHKKKLIRRAETCLGTLIEEGRL